MTKATSGFPYFERTEKNGCTRLMHSEKFAEVKHITLAAVAALALFVLFYSVLTFVCQQMGFSLPTFLSAEWTTFSLMASTVVLIIDVTLIVALTRSYQDQKFTEKELKERGIFDKLQRHSTFAKMPSNTYWRVDEKSMAPTDTTPYRPPAYIVLIKDSHGEKRIHAFKDKNEAEIFIELRELEGVENAKTLYAQSHENPKAYLEAQFGQSFVRRAKKLCLQPHIQPRHFKNFLFTGVVRKGDDTAFQVEVVVANCGDKKHPRLECRFAKPESSEKLVQEYYPKYRPMGVLAIDYLRLRQAEMTFMTDWKSLGSRSPACHRIINLSADQLHLITIQPGDQEPTSVMLHQTQLSSRLKSLGRSKTI